MNDEYRCSVLNFIMSMSSFNISLSALTTSNRIINFNSTFNSLRIDILLLRLINLGVNGNLICGIKDFLLNRPQKVYGVKVNHCKYRSSPRNYSITLIFLIVNN